MMLISAGTIVLDGRICRPGWIEIEGARISACGTGTAPRRPDIDLPDGIVVPGFVDMHVHGGGGASYSDGTVAAIEESARFHLGHGTTTTVASLVTAAPEDLLRTVALLADRVGGGTLAGIHLEGPWLSPARRGAHAENQLRDPDRAEIDALLAAGRGGIRMVTIAPEVPGAAAAIERLKDANVVVAVGHTDATYEQTRAAIEAGATVGTHVFNAMRPLHHREPGPALALLEDPRVTVELIADGVHIHPALLRDLVRRTGSERIALVTDAMAAAGTPDGRYRLGPVDVTVTCGVAHVTGTSTIAGSTATMDAMFRAAVAAAGTDLDAALTAAVRMTSANPARALGLGEVGVLRAGMRADLVALDADLGLIGVVHGGRLVSPAPLGRNGFEAAVH
ncbi:N-acetylglucosamine-6-phosphate deacetylase [Nocardia sp. CDC159]|uniref:N-acetylglucosamine-6-phosphate deacetylase n=1 Tax=Nocardia pulmonis TaxID=2951408 RepID=A0A9X2IX16_9NOCA|nr:MULTISPECIES: N-acetylglucosamine-6-phosphate deacetylase [Nocardia]MCM6774159.1 N-acetylglucosamine-6-phosphate deacetylase [Nocardia pulmonis]MCM6787046.1 N-acetylglucosamine-6-phosphate deacetylase [Nocardia sp. CDC159]